MTYRIQSERGVASVGASVQLIILGFSPALLEIGTAKRNLTENKTFMIEGLSGVIYVKGLEGTSCAFSYGSE